MGSSVVAYVDGGCRSNGLWQAKAYGSYQIGDEPPVRFDLPEASTNNQAEYHSLLRALAALREVREPVTVYMDSKLVVEQVRGRYRIRDRRLGQLCEQAHALIRELWTEDFKLKWVGRRVMLIRLGH